jgi:putative ABC transport system permease protein
MNEKENDFPKGDIIIPFDRNVDAKQHMNPLDQNYLDYLKTMDSSLYNSIAYTYGINVHLISKSGSDEYRSVNTEKINFQQLPTSREFTESQYDLLYGNFTLNSNEAVLIVDKENRVNVELLNELGIPYVSGETMKFNDFINKTFKIVLNNNYYIFNAETNTFIANTDNAAMYNNSDNPSVRICGILREKESANSNMLSKGIGYSSELNDILIENSLESEIVTAQKASPQRNVLTGLSFLPYEYDKTMIEIGGTSIPVAIQIYPKSFDSKEAIKTFLNAYNAGKAEKDQIIFNDLAEIVTDTVGTLIDTISIILSAFAAISLVVSSIMIGIITYVSVVERIKEIGILRSIGARKKDISRVFNAETVIIGFTAGVIGIFITLVLSVPINFIVQRRVQVTNIASLPVLSAVILILVSMTLTFIAGLIPSRIAAKKDPVVALRTE